MNKAIVVLLVLILATQVVLINLQKQPNIPMSVTISDPSLGAVDSHIVTSIGSITSVDLNATGSGALTKIVDANAARQNLIIQNNDPNDVCLLFSSATTTWVWGEGICLNANGGTYEMPRSMLYLGEIWGNSTTGSSTLAVMEQ